MTTNQTETWEQRREREDAERAEKTKQFKEKVGGVALFLGCTFDELPDNPAHSRINLENGAAVGITREAYGTNPSPKWEISGVFPRNSKGEYFSPGQIKIKVNGNRPIKTIAKEIQNRLLPEYLPAFTEQKKRAEGSDEYYRQTDESKRLAEELTRGFGGRVGYEAHGDKIHLKLYSLSHEQCKQLIEVYKNLDEN